jgi:hypothetical protein
MSFSEFLRKNGLLPPDFNLPEYDEESIRRDYEKANSNPLKDFADDEDDRTNFEICLINKENKGLFVGCSLF